VHLEHTTAQVPNSAGKKRSPSPSRILPCHYPSLAQGVGKNRCMWVPLPEICRIKKVKVLRIAMQCAGGILLRRCSFWLVSTSKALLPTFSIEVHGDLFRTIYETRHWLRIKIPNTDRHRPDIFTTQGIIYYYIFQHMLSSLECS
jgi:hypothetical protein